MDRIKYIWLMVFIFGLCFPVNGRAENLVTLTPAMVDSLVKVDDTIQVTLKLNSGGKNINAMEVAINYSTVGLEVVRVDKAMTSFPLWTEGPVWDNQRGQLSFSTGRPHGLIAAGVTVATIYIRPRISGLWQLAIGSSTTGRLNDNAGTAVMVVGPRLDIPVVDPLVTREQINSPTHPEPTTWYRETNVIINWPVKTDRQYSFLFTKESTVTPDDIVDSTVGVQEYQASDGAWWFMIKSRGSNGQWSEVTKRSALIDSTPPEPFTISLLPAASISGGRAISWVATDSGSGAKESRLSVGGRDQGVVSSPLKLQQKWGGKNLTIQVSDMADNVVKADWHDPTNKRYSWWPYGVIGGMILILAGALIIIRRKSAISSKA